MIPPDSNGLHPNPHLWCFIVPSKLRGARGAGLVPPVNTFSLVRPLQLNSAVRADKVR